MFKCSDRKEQQAHADKKEMWNYLERMRTMRLNFWSSNFRLFSSIGEKEYKCESKFLSNMEMVKSIKNSLLKIVKSSRTNWDITKVWPKWVLFALEIWISSFFNKVDYLDEGYVLFIMSHFYNDSSFDFYLRQTVLWGTQKCIVSDVSLLCGQTYWMHLW